jgi:adenine specific DNA methylase Mod
VEGAVYIQKQENLMWQDELYHDDEESAYRNGHSNGKVGSWEYANNYCRSLTYYGYSDWRLPTLDELMDLHQRPSDLKHSIASDFWSSTPDKGDNYKTLYTADGYPYVHKKSESHYFRCIRCFKDIGTTEHPASCRR